MVTMVMCGIRVSVSVGCWVLLVR